MRLILALIIGVVLVITIAKLLLDIKFALLNRKDKVSLVLFYSSPIYKEKKHKILLTIKKI